MKPRPLNQLFVSSSGSCRAFTCHRTLSYTCIARRDGNSNRTSIHNNRNFDPHARHVSSKATARKNTPIVHRTTPPNTTVLAKSTPSTTTVSQARAELNPPETTNAPELRVPPRGSESYPTYLYRCGKSYIAFYKQGISNVRSTLKLAKSLREKARRAGISKQAEMVKALTRAEWQIVLRSRADKLRLPAFGALLLMFGEWLPLLVVYLTPVVPEPCRIPAQVERSLKKGEERRTERERRLAMDAARLVAKDRVAGATNPGDIRPQTVSLEMLAKADLYTLLNLDVKFGIQPKIWDWLFMTPPKALLRYGLRNRISYLQKDDWAIRRDGGFQGLNAEEIKRACVERGIRVLGRKEPDLRKELAIWFEK